jgi:hypothetical protein
VWTTVYGDVKGFVGNVVGWITGLPGKIAAIAGRMASAGRSLLSAWWDGIKSAASGAAHFVGNIISSMANAIKNAINDILHLPWRLPDIKIGAFGHYVHVGGQTLFPRLREGGMTTGPGIFMMGDNPSGREVALPLDSPHTTRALGKALGAAGASGGGNLTVQVTFPGGTLIGSPVELGKAVKIGVEAAVNQGVKFNISQGIR